MEGHIMARKDNNLSVFVSGYQGLENALKTVLGDEVVVAVKDHNGILSLSTLNSERNGWDYLDFYAQVNTLTDYVDEWLAHHPGVTWENGLEVGFAVYNDTYMYQNPDFKNESPRNRLVLNRHIVARVEPRMFRVG